MKKETASKNSSHAQSDSLKSKADRRLPKTSRSGTQSNSSKESLNINSWTTLLSTSYGNSMVALGTVVSAVSCLDQSMMRQYSLNEHGKRLKAQVALATQALRAAITDMQDLCESLSTLRESWEAARWKFGDYTSTDTTCEKSETDSASPNQESVASSPIASSESEKN